jgi:hypothetical protein
MAIFFGAIQIINNTSHSKWGGSWTVFTLTFFTFLNIVFKANGSENFCSFSRLSFKINFILILISSLEQIRPEISDQKIDKSHTVGGGGRKVPQKSVTYY